MSTRKPSWNDPPDDPPAWLRWYSMALVCPDCGKKPYDPVWTKEGWGLPWPHDPQCPGLHRGGYLQPPEWVDLDPDRFRKAQEAMA